MFHGPAFRGVVSMDRWGADGAEATLRALPPEGLFRTRDGRSLVTDPVLLDQPGQVVGFWTAEHLATGFVRSEEHTSELQSLRHLVCRLLLEKKKKITKIQPEYDDDKSRY